MTYTSARWANSEHIGVLLIAPDQPTLFVDNGELYEKALAGDFGEIGLPIVIVSYPTAEEIREERNNRLAVCDWTQLPDAPVDQTAWAFYRQELRDITDQEGFPANVIWPVPPT